MNQVTKWSAVGAIALAIFVSGMWINSNLAPKTQPLTVGGFQPVQGKTYYLAGSGINNSQNTITLTSFTLPDPNNTPITSAMFSGTQYGVIDAQTSKIENISYTGVTQNANGSATLTGVTRGLSFFTPYAASTTLAISHSGGSTFILSNSAAFYGSQFALVNNAESVTGTWTFASTSLPGYDLTPVNWTPYAFVDKDYVDSGLLNGAATSTFTNQGLVQLATHSQMGLNTASSTNGSPLVIPNSFGTTTPYNGGFNVLPITNTSGKLSQLFIDLTQPFSFSGLFNSAATTTIAASSTKGNALILNNLPYAFSPTRGASSTALEENGSGALAFVNIEHVLSITSPNSSSANTSTTSVQTVALPAGSIGTNSQIRVNAVFAGDATNGAQSCNYGIAIGNGSAPTTTIGYGNNKPNGTPAPTVISGLVIATSTTNGLATMTGTNFITGSAAPIQTSANSSVLVMSNYLKLTFTGQLYLDFNVQDPSGSATSCQLSSESVEVLTN